MEENDLERIAEDLSKHLDKTRIWFDGRVYMIKELVLSINDLRIEVYRDHIPPHFHIVSRQRNINARLDIKTLDLISVKKGENKITSDDLKKIKNFFHLYPHKYQLLLKMHDRLN